MFLKYIVGYNISSNKLLLDCDKENDKLDNKFYSLCPEDGFSK